MNDRTLPSSLGLPANVDVDFAVWAEHQIELLRARNFDALDVDLLVQELESLVANDRRELGNRLVILLLHLLKCQFQSARKSRSWVGSIAEQRDQLGALFDKSPSLKPLVPELMERCYARAVKRAVAETMLPKSAFPAMNPYSVEQILDDDFAP